MIRNFLLQSVPRLHLIQVTSTVAKKKDTKFAFYRFVADELKLKLSVRPDDIMINMVFVDKEEWSFGDGQPW
uniref:tautomerase family protein n=1 Tax=Methylobacterium sp. B34 TaxID=95563 RepID=UPI00034DEB7C|nr:tautomerase family protein [Methylobacterium sp. B34]